MEDNSIIWKIGAIALGVFLLVALIFVLIFGIKLRKYDKAKAAEIKQELIQKESELKKQCQLEKEEVESTYHASDLYGNFEFKYPKVWNTGITEDPGNSQALTFLGSPNVIVNNRDNPPVVALRVIYFNQNYEAKVKSYGNTYKKSEAMVSNLKGTRVTGTDKYSKKKVNFVLIPLRDKTIYIGTDDLDTFSAEYEKILNTFVLIK
jgi:hypothetical protein